MELLPGYSAEETGWWVDQWLAALPTEGLSAGPLEHWARVLGRLAGMEPRAVEIDASPLVAMIKPTALRPPTAHGLLGLKGPRFTACPRPSNCSAL